MISGSKRFKEKIQRLGIVLLTNASQMGVASRGLGAGMAEDILKPAQRDTMLKHVCGIAVAQRVDGGFFLMPESQTICRIASCVAL